MELIESFIAILEAAAEQQAPPKDSNSTVVAHQPTQSQELAAVEALLFKKSPSAVQTATQDDAACL
jgi:hypothetical protein